MIMMQTTKVFKNGSVGLILNVKESIYEISRLVEEYKTDRQNKF